MATEGVFNVEFSKVLDASTLAAVAGPIQQAFLTRIITLARAEWVRLATQNLRRTRRTYIAGLSATQVNDGVAYMVLAGALPNMIELGHDAYDLHDRLLGSNVPVVDRDSGLKGKHQKKDGGYYRSIPFRQATPGAQGAVGQSMGEAYSKTLGDVKARELGEKIYALAKGLRGSKEIEGTRRALHKGKTAWGGRITREQAGPKLLERHHSPLMAGMVKVSKSYENARGNQYMTFRTISSGSPGWRVGAKAGIHLVKQVDSFVQSQAEATLRRVMRPLISGDGPSRPPTADGL